MQTNTSNTWNTSNTGHTTKLLWGSVGGQTKKFQLLSKR